MGTNERRNEIMRALCRRRYDTIVNLAVEFKVSERTMRRDIESLSLIYPIYTQTGRYGGGVYVTDNFYMDRMYFQTNETEVMKKIAAVAQSNKCLGLSEEELQILKNIIKNYTKPEMIHK